MAGTEPNDECARAIAETEAITASGGTGTGYSSGSALVAAALGE